MGAEVVVSGRSDDRGGEAVREIRDAASTGRVSFIRADLAVQAEVRGLADRFRERHDRLDVLVNNAGLVQSKRTVTPDGLELTLAVNHLAPFLLTNLLLEVLEESAPSCVITVSSEARRGAEIDFDDLQSERRYRGFQVYGMTKKANVLFTYELARRLEGTGVVANCLHPGAVSTGFAQNNRGPIALLFRVLKPFMRSPEQGADTLVYLASSPEAGELNGRYLTDRKEVSPPEPRDQAAQKRLWEVSEELTNLRVTS
jgi:NAD(P)-dependent dehydrogenase (short-subunit alcohol dehydrogenase family)